MRYIRLVIVPLLLLISFIAQGSHAVGIDLTYVCLGGNQYRFNVSFYRDCDGIDPPGSVSVSISSASCGISTSQTLSLTGSQEVSQICGAMLNNTTCNGGSLPGIEQYTYSGVFTLPTECSDWVIGYSLCCRNSAITNLSNPANQNLYVESHINNIGGACNSSPTFNALPVPYICVGQPFYYNHGAVDPDGNTLVYSLVNPQSASGTNIPYTNGYTPTNPMGLTGAFGLDANTGQMSFTPSQIQQGVITILIEEYDTGGNLVGTSMRDIQVVVINCSNQAPTASGIDGSASVYNFTGCAGSSFCFDINSTDVDGGDITTMTWNNGIPAGSFTTTGAPFSVGAFCWTPTLGDIGTHYFTVTVEDDACPIPGINTFIYEINVTPSPDPPVDAGLDQSVCFGETVSLNATAGSGAVYTWSPAAGLSCVNCANPSFTATTTGIYSVQATYPGGCSQTDDVGVAIIPAPTVSIFPADVSICSGSSATLSATSSDPASTFSWSPGGQTTVDITVTPGTTTAYTVTSSNAGGCTDDATSTVTVSPPPPTEVCNNIYVTTSGGGTGLTSTDPIDLASAIAMSQCNNSTIKLAIGTYTIDNPIVDILGYTTLEGGYDPGNAWTKTSLPGATTIFRSTLNPEGGPTAPRLVAIQMSNASYFRFQDLTVEVADAPVSMPGEAGMSTYALHMTSCSNYDIVRCQLIAGMASDGADGVSVTGTGSGSAGGAGGTGGGWNSGCDADGFAGTTGTTGSGGANAGTGGDGANGDGCNIFGCNAGPMPGIVGGNGTVGADGVSASVVAPVSNTPAFPFYLPNGQGTSGTDGFSGGGGGGGGGMSRGSDCTCSFFGTGNGGEGGDGGAGGLAGTGGFAGGGSFGVYLSNNVGGNFIDVDVNLNPIANGGVGGVGQLSSTGVAGGVSQTAGCGGSSASSGAGGTGGAGGAGGNGQPGADGISGKIVLDGVAPSFTQAGFPVALVLGINNTADFNLTAQPIINMENISCTNTDIDYSSGSSATWDLDAGAAPLNPVGAAVTTQYSTIGRNDIQFGAETYTGFSNITLDGVADPDINTTAFEIAIDTFVVCAGNPIDWWTTAPFYNEVLWDFGGAIAPNTYTNANLPGMIFTTAGTYAISLQINTDCCGWSSPVHVVLIVDDEPTISIAGILAYCENESTILAATTTSDSVVWTPNYGVSADTGLVVTFNPPATTDYVATAFSEYGICNATESFTVTVNELPDLSASSTAVTCPNNGTATIIVGNLVGPFNFQWNDGASQTTNPATNLYSGNYMVGVSDAVTGCYDSTFIYVDPGTTPVLYIQNSVNISCYEGSDGEATVGVFNGTAPFTFTWIDNNGGATIATGPGIDNVTGLSEGSYNVSVVDGGGCMHTLDFTLSHPDSLYIIDTSIVDATCYSSAGGSIAVTVDGGSGGYTYLWEVDAGSSIIDSVGELNPDTYTIEITDVNGCVKLDSFVINGPTLSLVTNAGIGDTICGNIYSLGAVPTPTITNGNWLEAFSTQPANYSSLTDPSTSVNIGTNYGLYTFYWEEDNGAGCLDTASVEILFVEQPVANATDAIFCSLTDTLNAIPSVGTGEWISQTAGVTFSNANSPTDTATVTAAGSYTFTWTENNGSGCIDSDDIIVQFSDVAYTDAVVQSTCGNADGEITLTGNNGIPTYQYSTDGGVTYQPGGTFTGLSANTYNISVLDNLNCEVTGTVTVSDQDGPVIIDVNPTPPTCFGGSDGSISINATGATGFSIDNGVTFQSSNVFLGLEDGTYLIAVENGIGCIADSTIEIIDPAQLTFTTDPTHLSCNGVCIGEIEVNALGGTGTMQYSNDNGANFSLGNTFTNLCAGGYDMVVQDAIGCLASSIQIVTEPVEMKMTLGITNPLCNSSCDGLINSIPTGGDGNYTYIWSNGGTLPLVLNLCSGAYSLNIEDGNGCSIDTTVTLVGPAAAVINGVIEDDESCPGACDGSVEIDASNVTLYSIDGVTFVASPIFTNLCSGSYTVYAQDVNLCSTTELAVVGSPIAVGVSVTATSPICIGGSSFLDGTITGGTQPYTYEWADNTGAVLFATEDGNVSPVLDEVYTFTATDGNGCTNAETVLVEVNGPLTVLSIDGDTPICEGSPSNLSASAGGGDGGPYTYTWDQGLGIGQNQTVSPTQTTVYTVTITDGCGTPSISDQVTVTVNTVPVISFTGDQLFGCVPVTTNFTDNLVPAGSTCLWDFGDGGTSTQCGNPSYIFTQPGCWDVTLTITTAEGCIGTVTIPNYVCGFGYPTADFTFGPQPTTVMHPAIDFVNLSSNADVYNWTFDVGGVEDQSTVEDPQYTFPSVNPGTYEVCLEAITLNGCTDTICQNVLIDEEFIIYVPNAFTPGGSDLINNEFKPIVIGEDPLKYSFMVFNRWGELIFESSQSSEGWDGTYQGLMSQQDVYVWKVTCIDASSKQSHEYLGHVMLLK